MLKLKKQFSRRSIRKTRVGEIEYYTYVHSESHKHFSTKQEKTAYCIHMIEYKQYKLKIRPSRGSNIANPWDDYPSYVYKMSKSWKYKSKRKRQYHN